MTRDLDGVDIGEALVDFFPDRPGVALAECERFQRQLGGAPANVAVGLGPDAALDRQFHLRLAPRGVGARGALGDLVIFAVSGLAVAFEPGLQGEALAHGA